MKNLAQDVDSSYGARICRKPTLLTIDEKVGLIAFVLIFVTLAIVLWK